MTVFQFVYLPCPAAQGKRGDTDNPFQDSKTNINESSSPSRHVLAAWKGVAFQNVGKLSLFFLVQGSGSPCACSSRYSERHHIAERLQGRHVILHGENEKHRIKCCFMKCHKCYTIHNPEQGLPEY
jgi:hypothetical protein